MTKIKICGLCEKEHAIAAAMAGADYLGFVFAESRRKITPEDAFPVIDMVRKLPDKPEIVGVFVNQTSKEINGIADYLKLDYVQLSGDESAGAVRKITCPVIKVIHVSPKDDVKNLVKNIKEYKDAIILLDTAVKGYYGGTGKSFNWEVAEEICMSHKAIVAGGLNPQNVGKLINKAKPWGIDVSGGVEIDGVKNIPLIKDFINEVRLADKELEV